MHSPQSDEVNADSELTNLQKYKLLLANLWYTWNPHNILPLIDLYGDGWRKNLPPAVLINKLGEEKLDQLLDQESEGLAQSLKLFREYFTRKTWFDNYTQEHPQFKKLTKHPIAYFCMEYGLIDWLQIYSGGLGILAGDYLKQASDMGIPFVGVGIFYHQGFFHQDIDHEGKQIETYILQDPKDFPLTLVKDQSGNDLLVEVEIAGHPVFVRSWELKIGKTKLYLLDTNFDKNSNWDDRMITANLYGGNIETRIRQEIVLGIAGVRLIKALNTDPSIYHMNEGHSAFLCLELARDIMLSQNVDFDFALERAKQNIAFTNHTLKQAGNDVFDFLLFEKYFGNYVKELKVDLNHLFDLGEEASYVHGGFSMTILALNFSKLANAVSKIHGQAAEKIWPAHPLVPITNGVHMETWIAPEIHALVDKYVGTDWHNPAMTTDYNKIKQIPPAELWEAHKIRKAKLINSLNAELGLNLNTEALTLAWSRRLVSYKRPDLIIANLEELKKNIVQTDMPLQILIAGKAHPADFIGKALLQKMNHSLAAPEFKNKVVIIPGYNWQLARRMVSGADVWLNTPYRFEEASGTSGMKASANGVLQFTTKDGWTDEVDWAQKGWEIGEESSHDHLHQILIQEILPLYFDRNPQGFNDRWLEMMLNSMILVLQNYSTERMMREYLEKIYSALLV